MARRSAAGVAVRTSGAAELPQVFRREGEYWAVEFGGVTCRLRDVRGMRHLATLLSRPHEKIAALALELYDGTRPPRRPGDDAGERARVNVTRAIAAALKRIAAHHRGLAEHLVATVKTGGSCVYRPDPQLPVRWVL